MAKFIENGFNDWINADEVVRLKKDDDRWVATLRGGERVDVDEGCVNSINKHCWPVVPALAGYVLLYLDVLDMTFKRRPIIAWRIGYCDEPAPIVQDEYGQVTHDRIVMFPDGSLDGPFENIEAWETSVLDEWRDRAPHKFEQC